MAPLDVYFDIFRGLGFEGFKLQRTGAFGMCSSLSPVRVIVVPNARPFVDPPLHFPLQLHVLKARQLQGYKAIPLKGKLVDR